MRTRQRLRKFYDARSDISGFSERNHFADGTRYVNFRRCNKLAVSATALAFLATDGGESSHCGRAFRFEAAMGRP